MTLTRPSNPESFPVASPPFGKVLGLIPLHTSYPFKPWFFISAAGQTNLLTVPQYYSSPLQIVMYGVGVPLTLLSLSLLPFLCGLSIFRSIVQSALSYS